MPQNEKFLHFLLKQSTQVTRVSLLVTSLSNPSKEPQSCHLIQELVSDRVQV